MSLTVLTLMVGMVMWLLTSVLTSRQFHFIHAEPINKAGLDFQFILYYQKKIFVLFSIFAS